MAIVFISESNNFWCGGAHHHTALWYRCPPHHLAALLLDLIQDRTWIEAERTLIICEALFFCEELLQLEVIWSLSAPFHTLRFRWLVNLGPLEAKVISYSR